MTDEEMQEALERISEVIAEEFPCTEGWTYSLDLFNTETGEDCGIEHGPHEDPVLS